MIQLTKEQHQALPESGGTARAVDPETDIEYVLLRADVFDRIRMLLDDSQLTSAEMLDRAMADDDANDPYLAALQTKYGASKP